MGKDIVFLVRLVTVEVRIVAVKCLSGIYRRAVGCEWLGGWVHIRCCGWGGDGFRSYSGSLLIERKSKQNALAPPLGRSPRLGMPGIRH